MSKEELLEYIKQQLKQGVGQEEIKDSLFSIGWPSKEVEKALSQVLYPGGQVPPPLPVTASIPPPEKFLGPTALLSEALKIYRKRLKTFIAVKIIPSLALFVLQIIGVVIGLMIIGAAIKYGSWMIILGVIFVFLLIITSIVFQIWGQTSLIYAVKDSDKGTGVKESLRHGWHKIRSYWWVMILSATTVFGGFMLLFIPGIIFAIWFSLAFFVLIDEDLGGMDALLKSREYVKGRWLQVLGRFLFLGLVAALIYLPFFLIMAVSPSSGLDNSWLFNLLFSLASLIFAPLATTYTFLIYENLKGLKGSFEFTPSGKLKAGFIIAAILGILVPIILFVFFIFTFAKSFLAPQTFPEIPETPYQTAPLTSYH